MAGLTKYKAQLLKIQYEGKAVLYPSLAQRVCDYLWRRQARRRFLQGELTGMTSTGTGAAGVSGAGSLDPGEETAKLEETTKVGSSWGSGGWGGATAGANPQQGSPSRRPGAGAWVESSPLGFQGTPGVTFGRNPQGASRS